MLDDDYSLPRVPGGARRVTHVLRERPGCHDLAALAAAHPRRYPGLLESAAQGNARARFDVLFAFPQHAIRLEHGALHDGQGRVIDTDFLAALDAAWQAIRLPGDATGELPFRGGWLLYLGYELAAQIEPRLSLPQPRARGLPTALALRCPAAVVTDRARGVTALVAERAHAQLLDQIEADLAATPESISALPGVTAIDEDPPGAFLDGVARVHGHLRAGDVFQVNLSREWRVACAGPPVPAALLVALRNANPAPFAGLLQQPGWAIASSSPERLVEVRGRRVQTRPIAGTRPRIAGEDAASLRELTASPKERAEHVMLIDLERNDLGRACVPGSVCVDEFMVTESHAHVHHIVSNIAGTLRDEITPGQVIAALFPGGTITGCPKVRCMEIIAELEGVPRGAYTGALGYLDRSGDMDLNILIRTLVSEGERIHFRAGAGIVADSLAAAELAETRAKARGLLRALGLES